ncbi:MAG: hypothetical protein ACI8P9_000368 [Parasphingorhabdus sp.]
MQFVRAITESNFELLQKLFTDGIIFTAATPGKTYHATGRTETVRNLRGLFAPEEIISKVVNVNYYLLPGRSRISYVIRGNKEISGSFEYEHQAYYQIDEDKISHLQDY